MPGISCDGGAAAGQKKQPRIYQIGKVVVAVFCRICRQAFAEEVPFLQRDRVPDHFTQRIGSAEGQAQHPLLPGSFGLDILQHACQRTTQARSDINLAATWLGFTVSCERAGAEGMDVQRRYCCAGLRIRRETWMRDCRNLCAQERRASKPREPCAATHYPCQRVSPRLWRRAGDCEPLDPSALALWGLLCDLQRRCRPLSVLPGHPPHQGQALGQVWGQVHRLREGRARIQPKQRTRRGGSASIRGFTTTPARPAVIQYQSVNL